MLLKLPLTFDTVDHFYLDVSTPGAPVTPSSPGFFSSYLSDRTSSVKQPFFLHLVFSFFFFNVYLFLRESAHSCAGGAEREGDRILSGLCADSSEPNVGLELTNYKIMT